MLAHRKAWVDHYGPIPLDEGGRTYEIHHIDGNHSNNDIENLKLVTIQEHYDIHYSQGDYDACHAIAMRMTVSPNEFRELARKAAIDRVKNNTHNLQGDRNPIHRRVRDGSLSKWTHEQNKKRVLNRTHNFQKRADGTSLSSDRVRNGTHHFTPDLSQKAWEKSAFVQREMILNGTHYSSKEHECPHCHKTGRGNSMMRWHFDKCKEKSE